MTLDSIFSAAAVMSSSNGLRFLYYFFICSLTGSMMKLSISSGMLVDFEAISTAARSKELKGLSKIMHCTFLLMLRDWLRIMEAPPIDLPHRI